MNGTKERILEQLLNHLESMDADELKPKAVEVEVSSMEAKPEDELMEKADEMGSDKGPMEKLMDGEDCGEMSSKSPKDEEELSDEELEEMIKEHLG